MPAPDEGYNCVVSAISVLFICIGNSCRSPMAEAMARAMGADRITAYSAGLAPLGRIDAKTTATLLHLGYPVDGLASKGLDAVSLESMDVVVSLVGPEGFRLLPVSFTARRESWSVRDPYGDDEEVYRAVAHGLETRVRGLVADLVSQPS